MGNSKVDEFKMFVKANPFLIDYIKKGKKVGRTCMKYMIFMVVMKSIGISI